MSWLLNIECTECMRKMEAKKVKTAPPPLMVESVKSCKEELPLIFFRNAMLAPLTSQ